MSSTTCNYVKNLWHGVGHNRELFKSHSPSFVHSSLSRSGIEQQDRHVAAGMQFQVGDRCEVRLAGGAVREGEITGLNVKPGHHQVSVSLSLSLAAVIPSFSLLIDSSVQEIGSGGVWVLCDGCSLIGRYMNSLIIVLICHIDCFLFSLLQVCISGGRLE